MHDGVLVVLPDVVVDEDVLNSRVEGVDPERLPATDGVGVSDPPGGDGQDGGVKKRKKKATRRRDRSGGSTYVPVEVVLEASQTLGRAHVLVQASLAVAARHPLSGSAQHRRRLAAPDLPRRRVHVQLQRKRQDRSLLRDPRSTEDQPTPFPQRVLFFNWWRPAYWGAREGVIGLVLVLFKGASFTKHFLQAHSHMHMRNKSRGYVKRSIWCARLPKTHRGRKRHSANRYVVSPHLRIWMCSLCSPPGGSLIPMVLTLRSGRSGNSG